MGKMLDDLTVEHIKAAVEMCGYDFDEMMFNHTRKRTYVDIRAIIWEICHTETGAMPKEIGRKFGWNRCTVYYSIGKARELCEYDKDFRNRYDSVYGYYMALESNEGNDERESIKDVDQGTGSPMVEEEG